ncbi:DUF4147 domain-containing protein [Pseudoalteromonas sp. B193]
MELVKNNPADIPILFIISGGGSSLMCLPVDDALFHKSKSLISFYLEVVQALMK